jgi:hypothetical protein
LLPVGIVGLVLHIVLSSELARCCISKHSHVCH